MMDITDDMYCGSLPDEIVSSFTCMLCYGIVLNPIKCAKCEKLFCGRCVPEKRKQPGKFRCYNKCGSKKCHMKLNCQEQGIFDGLLFDCPNDGCEDQIKMKNFFKHMKKDCKV